MPSDRITIGRFSTLTHLSQKALRLYDRKGILVPDIRDRFTGYRYYTVSQIESALRIRTLCTLGFGLAEIGEILSAHASGDQETLRRMIAKRMKEAQTEIARLEKVTSLLIENRDFSELFAMNVSEPKIKEIPAMRVISGRRTGTYEEVCGEVSVALMAVIFSPENQKNGVAITGPFLSLCYDSEYRETDADIEMAIPIQGPVAVSDPRYMVRTLPAAKVISVVYRGPYDHDGFSVAFEKAFRYAAERGLEPTGPDRQVYLNNPDETPAEELLTEVQIPVAG
ncbi:MAG: zinc-responsive transcriptional regulator [Methanoregulaceae archaeon PtaB.Bin056]|nr:MAG: zinc-responsive transcriptional regulator [Methanoregulaceae archaeon PtaB.Bin056]